MMDHAQHPFFQATNSERSPAPPYNGQNTNNVRPTMNANLPQRHQFDGMFLSGFYGGQVLQLFCKLTISPALTGLALPDTE